MSLNNFSIIIPVYNEANILRKSIVSLIKDLEKITQFRNNYEIIIIENGSTDFTRQVATQLAKEFSLVRINHLEYSSYGEALKLGIGSSTYEKVIIFNVDFWDLDFLRKTLPLLDIYDCIVGSKVIAGSVDKRPLLRRLITRWFNLLLRLLYGFRGTDTHGIKGLRKSAIYPIVTQCLTEREIFDTELLLRADRNALSIHELPVLIREVRLPRLNPLKRIPSTIRDLLKLYVALQFRPTIKLNTPHYRHHNVEGRDFSSSYQKVKLLLGKFADEEISFILELPINTIKELSEMIRSEDEDKP